MREWYYYDSFAGELVTKKCAFAPPERYYIYKRGTGNMYTEQWEDRGGKCCDYTYIQKLNPKERASMFSGSGFNAMGIKSFTVPAEVFDKSVEDYYMGE